jgi:prophage DNA circulation protein
MADQQLNIKLNVIDNASRAFTDVRNSIFNVRNALLGIGAGVAIKSLIDVGKQTNSIKIRLDELAKSGYGGGQAFDQLTRFAIQSRANQRRSGRV